jgi:histidyl-tRNA synthetase
MALPKTLPGFREFYPEALATRQFIFRVWRQVARVYGFQEFDGPVLEPLELFKAKSGAEIEQQLFSFTDKGGREVALRPEMTPTLARMIGARAATLKRPVKWFNIGEHYRYERQQKGRLRSFSQFNADIYGEAGPEAEAELIALLVHLLTAFGLDDEDFRIRLSDRDLWTAFLADAGLDQDQVAAVLVIIDKLERESADKTVEKLREVAGNGAEELFGKIQRLAAVRSLEELHGVIGSGGDALETRLGEWKVLLTSLEAMGLAPFVEVDLGIVRGLAYYTGFVFEAFDRKGEFRALAGGGRYNHLVKKLGGPDMPAVGFAIGDVVLGELLQARDRLPAIVDAPDVVVVIGGAAQRNAALKGVAELRQKGVRVEYPLREMSFGKQFKQAGQSGARLAVVFGEEEVERGFVKIKTLADGTEVEVPIKDLTDAVHGHLSA